MKRIVGIVLGVLAINTSVLAASFDCTKATLKIEKLVCDTPDLSKLDDELGKTYLEATQNANNDEQRQRLAIDQKYWLKHTRSKCADEVCVKQTYLTRLEVLAIFFKSPQPPFSRANQSDEEVLFKKSIASILKFDHPTSFAVLNETLSPDDLVNVTLPGYYVPEYGLRRVSLNLAKLLIDINSWPIHDEGTPLLHNGIQYDFRNIGADSKINYLGIINQDQFLSEQKRQTANGSGTLMIAKLAVPAIQGNNALVYVETKFIYPKQDPDSSGGADGFLFKKDNGDWQLVKRVGLWSGHALFSQRPSATSP